MRNLPDKFFQKIKTHFALNNFPPHPKILPFNCVNSGYANARQYHVLFHLPSCLYRVLINYRRISLRPNLSRKCCNIVKFVSITHSEDNGYVSPLPKTLADLREHIYAAVGNVTQDMLERVWWEWEYRLDICRVTRGVHIECIFEDGVI